MESIVNRRPVTVDKDQNLADALRLMEKEKVSRLLVTDEGFVKGIITEQDIANRLAAGKERKLKEAHIHVSSAMTKDLVVIPITSDVRTAARVMMEFGFSSLPVVEDDEIVGLITKTDIIKKITSSKEKVAPYYTKNPVMVNPGTTLVAARKLMVENRIHRLLVTDNGKLVGILTERDVARGMETFREAMDKSHHPDPRGLRAEHVMTRDPATITSETTVGEAASIMLERRISGLPVLAKEFGVLTKTDLVRAISEGRLL